MTVPAADPKDLGARNLSRVFFGVVAGLVAFYGYLAYQASRWSPAFFITDTRSDRSRVLVSRLAVPPRHPMRPEDHGRALFREAGCAICHGIAAEGGVKNPNYVRDFVPALNTMAEKLLLRDREEADAFVRALLAGGELEKHLAIPRSAAVAAQFASVRAVITKGNPGGKKDPAGPQPFDMPGWGDRLSEGDIRDILAYLVGLYRWEE